MWVLRARKIWTFLTFSSPFLLLLLLDWQFRIPLERRGSVVEEFFRWHRYMKLFMCNTCRFSFMLSQLCSFLCSSRNLSLLKSIHTGTTEGIVTKIQLFVFKDECWSLKGELSNRNLIFKTQVWRNLKLELSNLSLLHPRWQHSAVIRLSSLINFFSLSVSFPEKFKSSLLHDDEKLFRDKRHRKFKILNDSWTKKGLGTLVNPNALWYDLAHKPKPFFDVLRECFPLTRFACCDRNFSQRILREKVQRKLTVAAWKQKKTQKRSRESNKQSAINAFRVVSGAFFLCHCRRFVAAFEFAIYLRFLAFNLFS